METHLDRSTTTRRFTVLGAVSAALVVAQLLLSAPASAAPFTGLFGPTIVGNLADLNGDGVVNGLDDANAFYGDASIIDGSLDCDTWGATPNAGSAGSGVIDTADDCTMIGYDGTPDGVTIDIQDGEFQFPDGAFPTMFDASNPDNTDISSTDFAWSTISGKVDSNGNEAIGANDCHVGLIGTENSAGLGPFTGGVHILGNTALNANDCGFSPPPASNSDGLVDLNGDIVINATDSCSDGCFFGLNVASGLVQASTAPATLDLTPPTATNEVGAQHTVTAHVEDAGAVPVEGVTVEFAVTGVNPTTGSDVTDANGDATFQFTGANEGDDTIAAFADTDDSGTQNGGEPGDTATKTWTTVPPECPGYAGDPRPDIMGTSAGETLTGTGAAEVICGLGGDDTLAGMGGNDVVAGGAGSDAATGGPGSDTVKGGAGADTLRGNGGPDQLFGGRGNDDLFGGRGTDDLDGGPGRRDLGVGGPGSDSFVRCERTRP